MSDSSLSPKATELARYDSDGNEHSSSTADEFANDSMLETSNSLLSAQSSSSQTAVVVPPKGHPSVEVSEEAKQKCPYFSMQKLISPTNPPVNENAMNPEAAMSSSSEDEEGNAKRPKGGCPFLPSDRKKNPGLQHIPQNYSTFYQSRYAAYLEEDALMAVRKDLKVSKYRKNRKVFENYPIYLKHTLFHDDDIMQRIRKKDVVERFFAYDKYRERGNRLYNKKRYSEAIFLYERAFSCFRWLELKENAENADGPMRKKQTENKKETTTQTATATTKAEEEERKESNVPPKQSKQPKVSSIWYTEDNLKTQPEVVMNKRESEDENNHLKNDDDCEKDNEEQIKEYKANDGAAASRINSLINQRANELSEQEAQREALMKKRMQQIASGQNNEGSAVGSDSDRGCDDSQDENEENAEDGEKAVLERIAKNDNDDDAKSLSVEGFDDASDRNFSSESEKEIEIEEITKKQSNPQETVIIMDEKEKKRMIAEEMFLRKNEKDDEEFRKKYRLYITTFTDENIQLVDGEDLIDSNDIDLRQSMIVSALLSLGVCYLMLGNFSEAMRALGEAEDMHPKGSIPLLRKVQCRVANSASSYAELIEARAWLDKAEELKKSEKIFNSGNATLVVMNIMNHGQFFQEIREKLNARTTEVKEVETERIREMVERVVELQEIEADMIERGVIPSDQLEEADSVITMSSSASYQIDDDDLEMQMSRIIEQKYYQIMEGQMYAAAAEESSKLSSEKLQRTTKELRKFYETVVLMDYYNRLDFSSTTQNALILELLEEYKIELTPKNLRRFEKLKRETAKEVFNETQHNFAIYKWALDEYFERRKERKRKAEKLAKKGEDTSQPQGKPSRLGSLIKSTLFGKSAIVQFILLFVLFYFFLLFLRSSNTTPFSMLFNKI